MLNPGPLILKTGTFIGGIYAIRGYIRERLEDAREKMEEERRATETLRARFSQTQEDVSYTVLALLPTLSAQVLHDMDVDVLTRELQARSRARSTRVAVAARRPSSSLISSLVEVSAYPPSPYPPITLTPSEAEADTRSDVDSVAHSSEAGSHTSEIYAPTTYHTATSASFISETTSVTQSWVIDSGSRSVAERSRSPAASAVSGAVSETSGDDRLSESFISTTTNTTSNSETDSSDTRTKAELWNELKMLTFTRTLTTLYASTLLSLFTTLQLTLLARGKYLNSVIQTEKQERLDEEMRERMERELSPTKLILKGVTGWVGSYFGGTDEGAMEGIEAILESLGLDGNSGIEEQDDMEGLKRSGHSAEGGIWLGEIDDELENKYLTMSWWLLHVGWKDVGERVRRAAEEVFNGVSLKTRLSAIDLHRLIADVRRRVEHEVTFEGTERRTNFLSSLLPPTPETIYHVLTQGGYTSMSNITIPQLNVTTNFVLPDRHSRSESQEGTSYTHERPNQSTASATSSQLSHVFDASPALGVSVHPQQSRTQAAPAAGPSYLPPPPAPQHAALLDTPFLALLAETRAILTGADFAHVLEGSLDCATAVLFESLEQNVFAPEVPGTDGETRIRLAGLLPGLARWSQLALEGLPNELVDKILDQRNVECLSAIAFSRFEERFQ
ncbi:hypothetical protein HYPSUDRAFT_201142 [Hypholoma sublateritium FD-334 SS-4]|uniref:Peroxin-3 n=1 Tax=Hypholoma sublateritium (strain FD-334 SS-4) TaxID=945553 RepID=A0A0D2NYC8_HYPSF|nr:hypothetical protein HYPSUDRAFT_201142 [Hypholoma sublateritium FD-334 SS-4]